MIYRKMAEYNLIWGMQKIPVDNWLLKKGRDEIFNSALSIVVRDNKEEWANMTPEEKKNDYFDLVVIRGTLAECKRKKNNIQNFGDKFLTDIKNKIKSLPILRAFAKKDRNKITHELHKPSEGKEYERVQMILILCYLNMTLRIEKVKKDD
jgi:hypothetical protein